jgi:hypothetical protein
VTKKINWKSRAAEVYHISLAEAEGLKESGDGDKAPLAFMKIGAAMALQDLLLEYGVDVEQEKKSKIVLLS